MATRTILVVGATGQQGGEVIKALLNLKLANIRILALTRNADSPKAKALAEAHKGVVELVQGDATDPEPLFAPREKGSIDSLFVVTSPGKVDEEKQAIPLIDTAVAHGVTHVVFTSVDRGGDEKSWSNPTDIKHFYQKHNIEVHIRDKAEKEGSFTWTILRPVAFLDNMNPGSFAAMFIAFWAASLSPTTKLQLVSVRGIGLFAAKALTEPSEWSGKAISLAGDELTLDEARSVFHKVKGKDLPQSWSILANLVLWAIGDVGLMFKFFEKEGYGADIAALRKLEPSLQNFETWLKDSSKWE